MSCYIAGLAAAHVAQVFISLSATLDRADLSFLTESEQQQQCICHRDACGLQMGVTKETMQPGDGSSFPQKGQECTMHYTGTLTDGSKFDSSRDRNQPFKFKIGVGQVIKGWEEGVAQMSKGERAKLTCTPDYAYGPRGYPPVIPPDSTLIFDVELIDFK